MMNNDYMQKTKKLARISLILCRIAIWAAAVGTAILLAVVVFAFAASPDQVKPFMDSGKLNVMVSESLYMPGEAFASVEVLRAYLVGLLAQIAVGAMIFIAAARALMGLLKSVEEGEPFSVANVARLRRIGITLIAGAFLKPFVTWVAVTAASYSGLFEAKASSFFDSTLFLCGLLVIVLSGIFAYGARLQREHDQTV